MSKHQHQSDAAAPGKLRICLVAHNAYGELAGVDNGHAGGIERQQAMMARWLVRHGHDVSVITWDEGQDDAREYDGVINYKLCRRNVGLPVLRFFHPRWSSLCRSLARAKADIYYYNCGDLGLGQVALWCRLFGKLCVYSVANNPDCDPRLPVLKPWRERALYKIGLRLSHRIISQTAHQQGMLRDGFGLDSVVLPMPCEFVANEVDRTQSEQNSPRVLWVGRFSTQKRLDRLLDVAEACPHVTFDVVGDANHAGEYVDALKARAAKLPNVVLHGRLPREALPPLYRAATLLCCTSDFEGFPNTFLEAWSQGVPLLTTYDPDDLVATHGMGWTARDAVDLTATLQRVVSRPDERRKAGDAALRYFRTHHLLDPAMERFERVFLDLYQPSSGALPTGEVS